MTLFKKIFPEDETTLSEIKILHKHWYRLPEETMADETLYEIPCDLIRDVIFRHEYITKQKKMLKWKDPFDVNVSLLDLFKKRIKRVKMSKPELSRTDQESEGLKWNVPTWVWLDCSFLVLYSLSSQPY